MVEPDLSGRVALVTGSSSGIGRAFLLALADAGADVAVHYNESEAAAGETAEAARERGVDAVTVGADITDPDDVDRCFDAVEAGIGTVDVLVNNVGPFAPDHWTDIDRADAGLHRVRSEERRVGKECRL